MFRIENTASHIVIKLLFFKISIIKKFDNCIAIIDPGGIGDYILHRPYFKYFKQSPVFKNNKLIFIGREVYNNFVKVYDPEIFFDILEYDCRDKKKLKKELSKYKFKSLIHLQTMCGAIAYSHAKSERMDFIKSFKVKTKIANVIKNSNFNKNNEKYLKTIYNKFIFTLENSFETERLREFYEKLLEIKIPKEDITLKPVISFAQKYICISPVSVGENRNYSTENWVKIFNFLIENLPENINILVLGSKREETEINDIIYNLKQTDKIINLTNLIDVALVPSVIKNAEFLLSIETGTVHIAQAVGVKSICLSSGGFYGRFLPYKNNLTEYIFPDKFDEILKSGDNERISDFYDYEKNFKTSDIAPEKVINVLKKYI